MTKISSKLIERIKTYPYKYKVPYQSTFIKVIEKHAFEINAYFDDWDKRLNYEKIRLIFCNKELQLIAISKAKEIGCIKIHIDDVVTRWEYGDEMC